MAIVVRGLWWRVAQGKRLHFFASPGQHAAGREIDSRNSQCGTFGPGSC